MKDEQIGQLREEIAHQEELISKLNREKKNIGESKLKEEEQVSQPSIIYVQGGPTGFTQKMEVFCKHIKIDCVHSLYLQGYS